jgi:hypothetical protein
VALPNGTSYQFQYNIYGEVARLVLPTGGTIEYEHGAGVSNRNGVNHSPAFRFPAQGGSVVDNRPAGRRREGQLWWLGRFAPGYSRG